MPACSACGADVVWKDRRPVNPDGSPHWDACKAKRFSQAKKNGTAYQGKDEAGYRHRGKNFATWKRGGTTGPATIPSCPHGVPPWEVCPCSFPEHLKGAA